MMSKIIDLEQEGELPDIAELERTLSQITARILGYLGKEAAVELARMMESGEEGITFRSMRGNRKSSGGRRMITYSLGKGLKYVRVSSFPLNLFEGGRGLRSGERENARNIIRGKLRSNVSGRIAGLLEGAEKLIIDDWFNANKKGGIKHL
jgi:hypothetical protein